MDCPRFNMIGKNWWEEIVEAMKGTKMTRKRVIWVGGGSRVAVMEWR